MATGHYWSGSPSSFSGLRFAERWTATPAARAIGTRPARESRRDRVQWPPFRRRRWRSSSNEPGAGPNRSPTVPRPTGTSAASSVLSTGTDSGGVVPTVVVDPGPGSALVGPAGPVPTTVDVVPGAAVVVTGRVVVVVAEEAGPPAARCVVVVVAGDFVVAVGLEVVLVAGAVVVVEEAVVAVVIDVPVTTRVALWPRWSWGLQYRTKVPALLIGGVVKVSPEARLPEWMPSSSTSTV